MTNYENKMTAQFKFMGYKEDEILFDVQPKIHDEIEWEISIRPRNSMVAIYDLVETPTISLPVHPVEDAYISTDTPYNSINTGANRSFLVGRDIKGEHRGLIKFDLSSIDSSLNIKSAKLRIYYSNLTPNTILNLYTVNGEWSEYGVTYLNKPNIKDFLTSDYTINETESYIEFNVSPIVSNWIKGIPNNGFYLLSSDFASTFRSRESFYSPILFVEYKDPAPYKISYSKLEFEVRVKELGSNDVEFDVEVGETYTTDDIEWEVFAHDPNHIYTEDIEFEITSVEIIPTQASDDIEWEVVSAKSDLNQIQWEVTIPKHNLDNDIEFEITPSFYDEETIEWELTVNTLIYVHEYNDIEFDITISKDYTSSENTIEFDVDVNEYLDVSDIQFEIGVLGNEESDVEFDVEIVEHFKKLDIEWEIEVLGFHVSSENTIEFEIEIPQYNEESNLEFDIGVYEYEDSSIEFEVDIPLYNEDSDVIFDIGVWEYYDSNVEWEVYVPHSDIEFEVTPLFNDENTIEFEVNPRTYFISDIEFEITVPANLDDTEIEWEALIRAVGDSDVEFEVEVDMTKGYAYAFII